MYVCMFLEIRYMSRYFNFHYGTACVGAQGLSGKYMEVANEFRYIGSW